MLLLGTCSTTITPESPVGLPMGGYGDRSKTCTGVADELTASVFYLEIQDNPLFLISLDLVGISSSVLDHYRRKFSEILDVPFKSIIISCTHSHSTFESIGLLGKGIVPGIITSRLQTAVINRIMRKILVAMKRASAEPSLSRVRMGYSKFSPGDIARNRRNKKDEVDPKVMVVKFVDYADPSVLKGLIVNFGVHCTILGPGNTLLSGDWAGSLRRHLERALSSRSDVPRNHNPEYLHQDVCVGIFQGAEGNINPHFSEEIWNPSIKQKYINQDSSNLRTQNYIFPRVEAYGEYIANRVMEELHSIECKDVESYKNQCRKISIPTESIKLSSNFKDIMKYISDQFYKKLLLWLFSFVNSEILGFMNIEDNHHRSYCHVVQLGDLFLVLSPGEMFYEYGQRLMRHNGGKYYGSTLIFGLANDYSSYLYPVQEFAKGGYENVFQLAPKAGPYIVGALLRMLKNLTNSD